MLPIYKNAVSFDLSSFFAPLMIGMVFVMIPSGLVIEFVYDREVSIM